MGTVTQVSNFSICLFFNRKNGTTIRFFVFLSGFTATGKVSKRHGRHATQYEWSFLVLVCTHLLVYSADISVPYLGLSIAFQEQNISHVGCFLIEGE